MHTNDWNPPDWYRFVGDEAALLDARGFVSWVDLFTADGRYWMPTHAQALESEPALALFDETPEVLLLRAERLLHPMTHVQTPPSRTHHHVSAVRLQDSSEHQVVVSSMQWIVEPTGMLRMGKVLPARIGASEPLSNVAPTSNPRGAMM